MGDPHTWDVAGHLLKATNSTGQALYAYDGDGRMVEAIESGSTWYFAYSGTNILYENLLNSDNYEYTGKRWSAATGLYYYFARWYDPSLGRFISSDPKPCSLSECQKLNRYVYATNRPTSLNDPSGEEPTAGLGGPVTSSILTPNPPDPSFTSTEGIGSSTSPSPILNPNPPDPVLSGSEPNPPKSLGPTIINPSGRDPADAFIGPCMIERGCIPGLSVPEDSSSLGYGDTGSSADPYSILYRFTDILAPCQQVELGTALLAGIPFEIAATWVGLGLGAPETAGLDFLAGAFIIQGIYLENGVAGGILIARGYARGATNCGNGFDDFTKWIVRTVVL